MKYDTFFFKLTGDAFILRILTTNLLPEQLLVPADLGREHANLSHSSVLVILGGSGHDFTSLSGHSLERELPIYFIPFPIPHACTHIILWYQLKPVACS